MNRINIVLSLFILIAVGGVQAVHGQANFTVNTATLNAQTAAGVHPRLFLDNSIIGTLRANITSPGTNPEWDPMFIQLKKYADYFSFAPPPSYAETIETTPARDQRGVGNTIGTFAMMYLMTEQAPPASDDIWLEAEETHLTSQTSPGVTMITGTDTSASGQVYICTPTGTATNNPNTLPPSASYPFSNLRTGYYHVWARVYAPSTSSNSWFLNIDGNSEYSLSTVTTGTWTWVICGAWNLTPGNHVLNLTYQEQGVKFDKFLITGGSTTPSGLGTEEHWLQTQYFKLNANGVSPNLNNLATTSTDGFVPLGDQIAMTGTWLEPWNGFPGQSIAPSTPDAQQTVILNGTTSYDIWVRMRVPFSGHDSFFFSVDSATPTAESLDSTVLWPYNTLVPHTALTSNGYPYGEWVWKRLESGISLSGSHTLNLSAKGAGYSDGDSFDRFCILPAGTATPTDPNKYLVAAADWTAMSCSYPVWTNDNSPNDLAAGAQLEGIGLYYDWCYGALGTTDKNTITAKILNEGAQMHMAFTSSPYVWWHQSYLNNHLQVSLNGLTAAGLAIHNDVTTDTLPWLQDSMTSINNTLNDFGTDGVDQEGASYWAYGIGALLQYMDMANKQMGANMFNSAAWLSNTANYRIYFNLPLNSLAAGTTHINVADDPDVEWYGPDCLLRKLASQYNLPTAQWLAEQYDLKALNSQDNAKDPNPGQPYLNLLWYNPSISETSPQSANLPDTAYFDDLDFSVSRSAWDGNESLVAFQCGPPLGHSAQAKVLQMGTYVDWGTNHVHPAVNNFCIFGDGDWQIENSGYTDKMTEYENSLLVNNAGQLGESGTNGTFAGSLTRYEDTGTLNPALDDTLTYSSPVMDYTVGNATQAYQAADNLTRYERHLLYLKPDVLVVVDDVTLKTALPLELRFFPNHLATFSNNGSTYTTTSVHSKMNFNVLTAPSAVTMSTGTIATPNLQGGTSINRIAYRLTETGQTGMSTAVALTWSTSTATPKTVAYLADPDGTAWKFKVGTETMVLDRTAGHALDEVARAVTTLEAESGTLTSPIQIYSDSSASGGQYIATPTTTPPNSPDTLSSPSALYSFNVATTGTYAIWARVQAASSSNNSFYYYLNPTGSPTYTSTVSTTTYGSWVWAPVIASTTLNSGTNTLGIKYESPNCKIDQLIITDDTSYVPYGMY